MAILFAPPRFKATDIANAPIPGAFLSFYSSSTSAPQPIYTDPTLTIALTNPIQADGNGLFPEIWLDDSLNPYKVVFAYPDVNFPSLPGALIWTSPQYNFTLNSQQIEQLINPVSPAETIAVITPKNFAFPPLNPMRYGAVGDGTTDDSNAMAAWATVANAQSGQTAIWPSGATFLTAPLPGITTNNLTWQANGSTIKVKKDSWGLTGDGATQVLLTGTAIRIENLKIDGNQSAFTAAPVGRLLQFGNDCYLYGCSFRNSPHQGVRSGAAKGSIVACHFDANANFGFEGDVVSYLTFVDCSFDDNGYGFQKTLATNTFAAISFIVRYRSHHITLIGCQAMQNGRDGFCINQGSYGIKFIGCIAWMNNDGGFTLANDNTSTGSPGEVESPYDIEYVDCEAYNNDTSGLAAYCPVYNVTVKGGRYYNNHGTAGLLADTTSFNCGLYFAAGSVGINVDTKAYDDRQLCGISAVSGSGTSRTLTASNWGVFSGAFLNTIYNYPQVAIYDASGAFNGYGTATAEASGSVTIQSTAFNGTALGSIGAGWSVTQRLQHNGCMLDNNSQGSVHVDGFGQLPGPQPYYGFKVVAGYNTNGQNVLLPQCTLDPINELLLNPSFEADTANWTLAPAAGGSAARVTTTRRSVGALQLVGGTSAASTANASVDTNALLYAVNTFVEYSMWVYATLSGDGGILLDWPIGASNITTTVTHPGGGWKLLRIGAFIPPTSTGIIPNCFANAGKTVYFDVGSLRVRQEPFDNRDYLYPSRSLPV